MIINNHFKFSIILCLFSVISSNNFATESIPWRYISKIEKLEHEYDNLSKKLKELEEVIKIINKKLKT